MDINGLKYYKTIGLLQSVITKAGSLDEALRNGLKTVLDNTAADYAIIWYLNKADNKLHPYFWLCPLDLTRLAYEIGEGLPGKAYQEDKMMSLKDFMREADAKAIADFKGMKVASVVCVPFSNHSFDLGCIEFIKAEGSFSGEESDLCQILTLLCELSIEENASSFSDWADREIIMSVRNIHKSFKNGEYMTHVLKGVNFDVFKGEFLCFLGESGCGKSTILNIIGGLDSPDEGSFTFEGVDYAGADEETLTRYRRDNIGYIFQSYNLMPNLNAKENLDLIGELVENPLDSKEVLKLVGLSDKTYSYPSELSGGQQQRVSIARSLIKRPKMIFADEPTAALDYNTSVEVLEALANVIKTGTTLIMVTHNEEITRMADRIIRFRNGQTFEVTINPKPKSARELVW